MVEEGIIDFSFFVQELMANDTNRRHSSLLQLISIARGQSLPPFMYHVVVEHALNQEAHASVRALGYSLIGFMLSFSFLNWSLVKESVRVEMVCAENAHVLNTALLVFSSAPDELVIQFLMTSEGKSVFTSCITHENPSIRAVSIRECGLIALRAWDSLAIGGTRPNPFDSQLEGEREVMYVQDYILELFLRCVDFLCDVSQEEGTIASSALVIHTITRPVLNLEYPSLFDEFIEDILGNEEEEISFDQMNQNEQESNPTLINWRSQRKLLASQVSF